MKSKAIIISQENTKVRSDSCHSEECRYIGSTKNLKSRFFAPLRMTDNSLYYSGVDRL